MSEFLLLRHGITDWNRERRIQGRTDTSLADEGRAALSGRAVPSRFAGWEWFTSPLARARETAALLGAEAPREDPMLVEMNWGEWEGFTLDELRALLGAEVAQRESRGLDFRPTGGESPREVRARFGEWLRAAPDGARRIVVTHKGVIRAALSLATGWDMLSPPPLALGWHHTHHFRYRRQDDRFEVVEVDIELEAGCCAS